MSIYATRIKRNLRETIEQRDELLARIQTIRGVLGNYAEREPDAADWRLVFEMLNFIETGEIPNAIEAVH